MNQNRILPAHLVLELTDGLQKRLALDIAHRAAHFDDSDAGFLVCKVTIKSTLYFVCYMRDNLHGAAAVIAPPLFLQYGPVYFTGRYIGIFV